MAQQTHMTEESKDNDWTYSAWDLLFGMDSPDDPNRGAKTYLNPPKLHDPVLERQRISHQTTDISFDECLDGFERTRNVSESDAWYCPRCKEPHRASSKLDLWRTPDILICRLKRLSWACLRKVKIDKKVNFPVEDLDLERRVRKKEDGKIEVYDLIGVVEHFGGLAGGHNTASAKNFIDETWCHYDDSIVEVLDDPNTVVRAAAYVLFYRRRSEQPLRTPRFSHTSKDYTRRDSDTKMGGDLDDKHVAGAWQYYDQP